MRIAVPDYSALYAWSIADRATFWSELWDWAGVIGERGTRTLDDGDRMPGSRWFPEARLNYAQNLLARRAHDDVTDALVFWGEDKIKRRMSHAELYASVSRAAQALRGAGVAKGDRVAGYLPNMPETIVAMLATSAIGAIWSSASPDFGVQGVLDRFGQIEPVVLFTVDGYWYNGKPQPILDKVAGIAARIPSLRRVVVAPYLGTASSQTNDAYDIPRGIAWDDFLGPYASRARCVRAAALRPSSVHHVFVGDDGRAEMHRSRGRRHAAAAP